MRAWVQEAFGGPEVLRWAEVDDPEPGPGEVVLSVAACALNRLDLLQRVGPAVVPGFALPHVAGMDIAGTVLRTGAEVELAVGSPVVVDPVLTCGHCERCRRGFPTYCSNLRTIGSTRAGGYAEQVLVPAAACLPAPAGLSAVEAASLPVAGVTAWRALITVGQVQAGETVLVPAAGSGVGAAAVQLAVSRGARVLATVGSAAKVEPALMLGAAVVFDRSREDWVAGARAATAGWGVDLVVDHVGGRGLQQAVDALALEGRVVLCGSTDGTRSELSVTGVYHWGRRLLGTGGYTRAELEATLAAYAAGEAKPVVDSVFDLTELRQAQARVESGAFFGKVVLTAPEQAATVVT